jgi:hypothetical protein
VTSDILLTDTLRVTFCAIDEGGAGTALLRQRNTIDLSRGSPRTPSERHRELLGVVEQPDIPPIEIGGDRLRVSHGSDMLLSGYAGGVVRTPSD